MKKIALLITVCVILTTMGAFVFAAGERDKVPAVVYLSPDNDSTVDLTGKDSLTFRWSGNPMPGGGRDCYRFKLIKGFGYNSIMTEQVGQGIFSIEVPADKFEDGQTYSWYVQQRSSSIGAWSRFAAWSFKAVKK